MHKRDREHGIDYFNCGAWIDAHPTYITVGEEGVRIHEYAERADDRADERHSDEERSSADSEGAEFADEAELVEGGEYDGEYERVGR
jgi:DNA polymerase III delta subunit